MTIDKLVAALRTVRAEAENSNYPDASLAFIVEICDAALERQDR